MPIIFRLLLSTDSKYSTSKSKKNAKGKKTFDLFLE